MEEQIEETQRQIRRSSELIQAAFEGLSTLHSRVTEATSIRTPGRTHADSSHSSGDSSLRTSGSGRRNTMDPGHDAILLLSPSNPELSSTADLAPPTPTREPEAHASPPSPSRPRTSDPTLASLRDQIVMSTESVRNRAGELDELRRAIALHGVVRQRQAAQSVASDPPRSTTTGAMYPSTTTVDLTRDSSLPTRNIEPPSSADDSSTALGAIVAARTALSPAHTASNNNPGTSLPLSSTPNRTDPSSSSSSPARGRPSASQIPIGIATRLTRLAQEIQSDISRISQQSESLMSWINENRARLDAGLSARPLERPGRAPSPSASRTPRPSHAVLAASADSTPRMTPTVSSEAASSRPRNDPFSTSEADTNFRPGSDRGPAAAVAAHPTPVREIPRAERRRLGLEGVSATNLINTLAAPRDSPLMRGGRVDRGSPSSRASQPPPPSRPSRVVGRPVSIPSDAVEHPSMLFPGARPMPARRPVGSSGEDEDAPRATRVRRRLNADGDEVPAAAGRRREVVRESNPVFRRALGWPGMVIRPQFEQEETRSDDPNDPAARRNRVGGRRSSWTLGEEDGDSDDTAWFGAIRRLDAMSRGVWTAPPQEPNTRMDTAGASTSDDSSSAYPVNLGGVSRQPSRSGRQGVEMTADGDIPLERRLARVAANQREYERDRAAMLARALALTSPNPPQRTLSGRAVPPPPPPMRPVSLVSTTQTTPGSLWNDSGVRVRLRAAVARLDEDMRALDAARERAQTGTSTQQPQPSAEARSQTAPRFWSFDSDDPREILASPSPPLERASDAGARCAGAGASAEVQPVWGSPTPFYPSPLPLPRVEEVSSLQARSQVFGRAKKVARIPRRRTLAGR